MRTWSWRVGLRDLELGMALGDPTRPSGRLMQRMGGMRCRRRHCGSSTASESAAAPAAEARWHANHVHELMGVAEFRFSKYLL